RNTAVSYALNDRLCLDGRRLVLMAGSYGAATAQHRTDIDDFTRVTQAGGSLAPGSTTYFKVEHQSGQVDWYGFASANAQFGDDGGRHVPPGAPGPLSWARVRQEDRHGNFVRYRYSVDPAYTGHGEFLIAQIHYTGHGADQGNRMIDFKYGDRGGVGNDITSSYLAGGLTMQRQRLTRISTFAPASQAPGAGLVRVRDYDLGYGASAHTGRSLLKSITECAFEGSAARCKPATDFDWQDGAPRHVFR